MIDFPTCPPLTRKFYFFEQAKFRHLVHKFHPKQFHSKFYLPQRWSQLVCQHDYKVSSFSFEFALNTLDAEAEWTEYEMNKVCCWIWNFNRVLCACRLVYKQQCVTRRIIMKAIWNSMSWITLRFALFSGGWQILLVLSDRILSTLLDTNLFSHLYYFS